MLAAITLLALLPSALASGPAAPLQQRATASELAVLASSGDAVQLWDAATRAAAAVVVSELRRQDPASSAELKGIDLAQLRIWHGASLTLGLQADSQKYSFVMQSEQDWRSLTEVLPATRGGLLPRHDWDSIDRDWLAPVSRGSLLPDFALEGPVDVYLRQPTALQLYLPHATDAGVVRRVLLREGAAVIVRGARAVRLRRGLDLPPISLSEFADIVTEDARQQQPLGVMHLLAGVQVAAATHWNSSHPDTSLGLVAMEVEFSPAGAALLAAPSGAPDGSSSRLRVRRVKEGAIELLPREASPGGVQQQAKPAAGAVALPSGPAPPTKGPWPITSVHPMQLQSYERLLREVLSSRLFGASSQGGGSRGGRQQAGGFRVARDVQLRLLETEAEATTLLKMQLELERRPVAASAAPAGSGSSRNDGKAAAVAAAAGAGAAQQGLEEPPDPMAVLARVQQPGQLGPHETWTATVQMRGDAQRGTLRFVLLLLERVEAAHDTVQFAPGAVQALFGQGNGTSVFAATTA